MTRKNTKNKAEVENRSSIGNISKENCNTGIIETNEKKKKKTKKMFQKLFLDHIPELEMMNILRKQSLVDDIQYVKGHIRVNPFYKCAYLRMDNEERDLLIIGIQNRNRAFEGDLVVACVNPEEYWHMCSDGEIQKTGKVVCILEKVHSRKAVGYLKKQKSVFVFYPKDQRVPLIDILPESVPFLYHDQPELCKNIMFLVNIDFWEQLHAFG